MKTKVKRKPHFLREDSTVSRMYRDLQSLEPNHPLLDLASINDGGLQFTPEFYTKHPQISEGLSEGDERDEGLLLGRSTIRYSLELSDALKEKGRPGLSGYTH